MLVVAIQVSILDLFTTRIVHYKNSGNEYTEWMTPELALKQAKERNEYNTLNIQMRVF